MKPMMPSAAKARWKIRAKAGASVGETGCKV